MAEKEKGKQQSHNPLNLCNVLTQSVLKWVFLNRHTHAPCSQLLTVINTQSKRHPTQPPTHTHTHIQGRTIGDTLVLFVCKSINFIQFRLPVFLFRPPSFTKDDMRLRLTHITVFQSYCTPSAFSQRFSFRSFFRFLLFFFCFGLLKPPAPSAFYMYFLLL